MILFDNGMCSVLRGLQCVALTSCSRGSSSTMVFAVCCSVLQCVVVCCSVVHCGAEWHCSVLQCVAERCSVLQRDYCKRTQIVCCYGKFCVANWALAKYNDAYTRTWLCGTMAMGIHKLIHTILQHLMMVCTNRNTLQHNATQCNTLQHTTTHCITLHHTATHCNTLQHTATHNFCSTR